MLCMKCHEHIDNPTFKQKWLDANLQRGLAELHLGESMREGLKMLGEIECLKSKLDIFSCDESARRMLIERGLADYRMRLGACLVVAEGGSVPTDVVEHVRECVTVQAVQRLAAENARLRAVVEAARDLRAVELQREKDEVEYAASGATYGIETLITAREELDAALSALDAKGGA